MFNYKEKLKNALFITISILAFLSLSFMNEERNMKKENKTKESVETEFVKVNDSFAAGTSLILYRLEINKNNSLGDFLSRIWSIHGEPNSVRYEGFSYTFKHKKSGHILTAYCGGGGAAYGGFSEHKYDLLELIKIFELELSKSKNIDCSIEFMTDFGTMIIGAKDGIPFDKMKN